jgi:hypothetical protein
MGDPKNRVKLIMNYLNNRWRVWYYGSTKKTKKNRL